MAIIGNIVDLTGRRKAKADPSRDAVERHWQSIRGADGVPRRDAIDPSRMLGALDRLILVERIAPRQARIRIAGQRVNDLLSMDLRGMPLSCLIAPSSRGWLGDCLEALFDGPARVDLGLAGPRGPLRPRVTAELVLLPLRDREGAVSRALCYADLPERTGAAPLRMEISGERRSAVAMGTPPAAAPDRGACGTASEAEKADRAREAAQRRQALHLIR